MPDATRPRRAHPRVETLEDRTLLSSTYYTRVVLRSAQVAATAGSDSAGQSSAGERGGVSVFAEEYDEPSRDWATAAAGAGRITPGSIGNGILPLHFLDPTTHTDEPIMLSLSVDGTPRLGAGASADAVITVKIIPRGPYRTGDPGTFYVTVIAGSVFGDGSSNLDVTYAGAGRSGSLLSRQYRGKVEDPASARIALDADIGETWTIRAHVDMSGQTIAGRGYLILHTSFFPDAPPASATVEINDSGERDNIAAVKSRADAYDPDTPAARVAVTNTGRIAETFSLIATREVRFDPDSLFLGPGQTGYARVIPLESSPRPLRDRVRVVRAGTTRVAGQARVTFVKVGLPKRVRGPETPDEMRPDRIPPRAETPFMIKITPDLRDTGQAVTLNLRGHGDETGKPTFLLRGRDRKPNRYVEHVTLTRSTQIILTTQEVGRGPSPNQTKVGHAGELTLEARVGGRIVARTPGFSVAAIPFKFHNDRKGTSKLGDGTLALRYRWESDSGDLRDLDMVWLGELVKYSDGGNHLAPGKPWQGLNAEHPTVGPPPDLDRRETWHTTRGLFPDRITPSPVRPGQSPVLPRPGLAAKYTSKQVFGFHDYRTAPRGLSREDLKDPKAVRAWMVPLFPTIKGTFEVFSTTKVVNNKKIESWWYQIRKEGEGLKEPIVHRVPLR